MDEMDWRTLMDKNDNYLPVPCCLLAVDGVTVSAALVYAAIADDDVDGDNISKIGHGEIIRKTGLSRRKVIDAVKELVKLHLIEPEPVRTGRGNVYRITIRLLPPVPQKRKQAAERRASIIKSTSENMYFRKLSKQG